MVGAPLSGGDIYEGNVLQVAPVSPGDFMRNLAPQWPEPEPGAAAAAEASAEADPPPPPLPPPTETDAFLRPPQVANGVAGQPQNR